MYNLLISFVFLGSWASFAMEGYPDIPKDGCGNTISNTGEITVSDDKVILSDDDEIRDMNGEIKQVENTESEDKSYNKRNYESSDRHVKGSNKKIKKESFLPTPKFDNLNKPNDDGRIYPKTPRHNRIQVGGVVVGRKLVFDGNPEI